MMNKRWVIVFIIFLLSVAVVFADPPKISLVVKPMEGEAPLTIMAIEESGDPTIVDWQWDFGDGNRAFKESKIEHIYEKAGEYKLVCTVINEKGEETSDSVVVMVKEPTTIQPTPTPEETSIPEPTEIPTRIVYQGSTAIRDSLSSKSPMDSANAELSVATVSALKDVKYPYDISTSKDDGTKRVVTIFKMQKFRCDEKMQLCGYWIEATRDGQEVQINSPVWISPPPYQIVVSEVYDSRAKENVVTIKEDPKVAVEQVLQNYVDQQPLGKATVGTKE
jgi:PKD repeat protein